MDWLTQEEIKAAAKKSEKAAIACSVKHWEQILAATKWELQRADHAIMYGKNCALCIRHKDKYDPKHSTHCSQCSLGKIGKCEDYGAWRGAVWALEEYLRGRIDRREFRCDAQPMLDLLKSL